MVTRRLFRRTPGDLLAVGAILTTRRPPGWNAAGSFLIAWLTAVNSVPCWRPCALLTALRPPCCLETTLAIIHFLGHRRSSGCSTLSSLVPSLLFGRLLAVHFSSGHSARPWPLCAILATQFLTLAFSAPSYSLGDPLCDLAPRHSVFSVAIVVAPRPPGCSAVPF